jgi:two-component system NtrC family response regulator
MIKSRILIVDDEEEICDMLADFLQDRGYETFIATTGADAVALIKAARPHLMLLDIRMPEMSGIDILRDAHAVDKEVGVIMITGYQDVEIAQEALKIGASDFVTKPIDLNYLETSVQTKLKAMLS